MHDVEDENDSAVKITQLPEGEELQAQPFQGDGGATKTQKPRLSRSRQYMLAGGTALLVLVVILVSVLALRSQQVNQPSRSRQVSVPTTLPRIIPTLRTIPTPAGKPITSAVWSDHQVSMAIAGDVAYAGTFDNAVYALHINNGSVLWRARLDGSVEESPVVVNGIVYVSSYVGQYGPAYLYALRASDGAVLWRYSGNGYIYSPTLAKGVVYIAAQDEGITALRASDGTQLWHIATQQGPDSQLSPVVNGVLYTSVVMAGQVNTAVIALRASDGSVLWRYAGSDAGDILTISNGVIYMSSQGQLAALRASNGHELWSRTIDTTFYQSPQVYNGVIYLMTTKYILENTATPTAQSTAVTQLALLSQTMTIGVLLASNQSNGQLVPVKETLPLKEGKSSVYAIRASDGAVLWQYPINKGGYSFADWLQVEHGVVYASAVDAEVASNTGYFYALRSNDGSVIWQDEVNGSPSGTLLSDGVIYATVDGTSNSGAYALRASDGALVWSYPIGGTVFNDPVLVGTTVYVGADNGIVYALRADNGALVWHYLTNVGS